MANPFSQYFGPRTSRVVSHYSRGQPNNTPYYLPPAQQSSGGSSFNLQALIESLQQGQTAARQASLNQYQTLMKGVRRTRRQVFGQQGAFAQAEANLAQTGATERARIADDFIQQGSQADQDLMSRGLGNTTIRSSVQRGVASDRDRSLSALAESEARQRSDLQMQRAGALMDFGRFRADSVLSRANEGPDQAMYADLISRLAAAGGATGASGTVATPTLPASRPPNVSPSDWARMNPRRDGESTPDYYRRIGI